MAKDYMSHPVIIKAEELAEALRHSEAFNKKNIEKLRSLIVECNQIIVEATKIDYGAVCQPKSCCS